MDNSILRDASDTQKSKQRRHCVATASSPAAKILLEHLENRVLLSTAPSLQANVDVTDTAFALSIGLTVSFTSGNRVQANASLVIRTAPPTLADTGARETSGGIGTVSSGPIAATLNGTLYSWYNVSWDDGKSGWSADIGLNAAKPTTPTNPSPGTTSSPGPVQSSSTVTLSWGASSGATYYDLGVTDIATGQLVVDTTTASTSYQAALTAGKAYRWNVAAANAAGESSFTTLLYFQTPATPLPAPMLTAPVNGATGQSASPTLTWSQVTGNQGYRIIISTNSADMTADPTSSGGSSSGAVTYKDLPANTTSYTYPLTLAGGTLYYWEVHALGTSSANHGYWSQASFTTAVVTPTVTVTSPNGGENWPLGVAHTISWSVAGDTSPINSFLISYSLDGGSTYLNDVGTATANSRSISWTPPLVISPTVVGKIRVQARNASNTVLTQDVSDGTFTVASTPTSFVAGFDREYFPAHADTMADLIQRTNLRWCGYYLDGPSQRLNTGWLGERSYLQGLGWQIAPLYVGQQDPNYKGGKLSYEPSSQKGSEDGDDAVAQMGPDTGATEQVYDSASSTWISVTRGQGFAPGTIVYLDWESPDLPVGNDTDYIIAWCKAVAAAGYQPGVYCHPSQVPIITQLLAQAPSPTTAQFWVAYWTDPNVPSSTTQFPTSDPTQAQANATSWQYGNVYSIQTINGLLSGVDLDTSSLYGIVQPPDTTAPGNIGSFTATSGAGQVGLTWSNPTDSDYAGVQIIRKAGSYPDSRTDGMSIYSGNGTSTTDTALINGTTYYYKAFSYDGVPNYSGGVTANATPQALPAQPSSPTPANGSILGTFQTLDWADASGAASYDVYLDNSLLGNTAASNWTLGTTPGAGSHAWYVVAKNSTGSTPGPNWMFTIQQFGQSVVLQPGPTTSKDIWTTSYYSYADGGSTPGGGKDDDQLRVGGVGDTYQSLLQFDLTGMPTHAYAATLSLYVEGFNDASPVGMYLDRITQAWDWKTQGTGADHDRLWWADRPATSQWSPSALPAPAQTGWYTIDLTTLYNDWKDGALPNDGIQLRPVSVDDRFNIFLSSEYAADPSLRPKLSIQAALPADANEDRAVNFNDLVILAQNYNTTGKTWSQGDFTGDGNVDFNDLVKLAQNYNTSLDGPALPAGGLSFQDAYAAAFAMAAPKSPSPLKPKPAVVAKPAGVMLARPKATVVVKRSAIVAALKPVAVRKSEPAVVVRAAAPAGLFGVTLIRRSRSVAELLA